jgi:hypothetical protein
VNSVKSAAIGTAMAAVSFIAIPMLGFQKAGIPGLVAGGLAGTLYAMIFAAVGFSYAVYQLVLGAMATPSAWNAARLGQIWKDNVQDYEFYFMDQEVQELASQSQYNQNNNRGGNVKDMSYYELLHVPATAVPKEIKRAYYRQARDVHPDKNKGSEEAAEKFRKIAHGVRYIVGRRQTSQVRQVRNHQPARGWRQQ